MPQQPITQADKDFLRDVYNFAAHRTDTGVYLANVNTTNGRALILVAMGESADAVNSILMKAAVSTDEIIHRPSASDFLS